MKALPRAKRSLRTFSVVVLILPAAWTLPAACSGQTLLRGGSSGTIFGKVLFASDDRPAEHVRVQLQLPNGAREANTFTGQDGEFDFEAPSTGQYQVVVEEPGYQPIQESVDVDFGSRSVQLRLTRSLPRVLEKSGPVVSARDLSIPAKARKAFDEGMQRLSKKDTSGSLNDLRRAIARFPTYYEAYYQIGVVNSQLERQREAEQAFRQSIDTSGGRYAQAYVALGAILCDQGKFAEAEEAIRVGVKLDAAPWLGHFYLARALFGLGHWDEAEKSVRETTVRNAELPEAYLLLAGIHFNQHNYTAVAGDLDAYLKLDPNSPTATQAGVVREKLARARGQRQPIESDATAETTAQ
jgi:tetratricopeptide (TPR) repeat protein